MSDASDFRIPNEHLRLSNTNPRLVFKSDATVSVEASEIEWETCFQPGRHPPAREGAYVNSSRVKSNEQGSNRGWWIASGQDRLEMGALYIHQGTPHLFFIRCLALFSSLKRCHVRAQKDIINTSRLH